MLQQLFDSGKVWQGNQSEPIAAHGLDSGYPALNEKLSSAGWPADGVIEILHEQRGIGEINLILPVLAMLSQQEKYCVWVAPPYRLCAPALLRAGVNLGQQLVIQPQSGRDTLWTLEECLRSKVVSLVAAWPDVLRHEQMRRLQLLASQERVCCFLFRAQGSDNSPCSLRLHLRAVDHETLQVHILKRRQGWSLPPFLLKHRSVTPFLYPGARTIPEDPTTPGLTGQASRQQPIASPAE